MADRTAALREQRDFLLGSLTDLEAEYAAGDLGEADYRALKADYTVRAARTIRAVDAEFVATTSPPRSWTRIGLWTVGIVLSATLAGVLLAQFSGSRSEGDSISGDIRTTSRELLFDARQAFGSGDIEGAIEIYDQVLDIQPSSSEALAYQAWMYRLSDDSEAARPLVEDAVAIDPDYPDARVFGAAIALDLGDVDAAAAHLAAFDALDAPPIMVQLVSQQGLRDRIVLLANSEALDLVEAILMVDDPPSFVDTDLTVDNILLAAEALAVRDRVLEALALVNRVVVDLAETPDPDLLAGYGWLLARSATPERPEPAQLALPRLNDALALAPDHAQALIYRSFVHAFFGDVAAAEADLATFDALDRHPSELLALIEAFGLREQLS